MAIIGVPLAEKLEDFEMLECELSWVIFSNDKRSKINFPGKLLLEIGSDPRMKLC